MKSEKEIRLMMDACRERAREDWAKASSKKYSHFISALLWVVGENRKNSSLTNLLKEK
jgi:hypothetical protein